MFDVEKVVGEWVKMWNQYDLSQVDDLFLDSDDLTYFSSDREGVIKGLDAVREHHRRFGFVPGGKKHGNKLWVEKLEAFPMDSVIIATGIWHFRQVMGRHQWGPFTLVYVRRDERFLLAHTHFAKYGDEMSSKA
jgi:ketosteroid isomerase-like protein